MTLRGEPYLLWRAVDQHGAELEILLQKRRDKAAAKRFFKCVLAACPVAFCGDADTPIPSLQGEKA